MMTILHKTIAIKVTKNLLNRLFCVEDSDIHWAYDTSNPFELHIRFRAGTIKHSFYLPESDRFIEDLANYLRNLKNSHPELFI